jgi:competence ComEA-like helix-hairpin-helix protein
MQKLLVAAIAAALALPALGAVSSNSTVNVNTAQQSELQSIQGLDRATARSIIQYRNRNGPYHSLDDLARALGEPTTEKIASQVAFDGPPYVGPEKPGKRKKKGG